MSALRPCAYGPVRGFFYAQKGAPAVADIVITTEQMYNLLLKIDRTVTQLAGQVGTQATTILDHETRIRQIESAADDGIRITAMEDDVKAIRADLEGMKRKVYAIPGASVLIAAAAIVLTLVKNF